MEPWSSNHRQALQERLRRKRRRLRELLGMKGEEDMGRDEKRWEEMGRDEFSVKKLPCGGSSVQGLIWKVEW